MRSKLTSAGDEFWHSTPTEENGAYPGLSFFHFDGDEDGEDIKADFKQRFQEVEAGLTDMERGEIVEEAQYIFERVIELVGHLDGEVADVFTAGKDHSGHAVSSVSSSVPVVERDEHRGFAATGILDRLSSISSRFVRRSS